MKQKLNEKIFLKPWSMQKWEFNLEKFLHIAIKDKQKKGAQDMSTLHININEKANLIWAIADKLTGPYKPHEYGEVILPLTVIGRFDCILGKTKDAVVQKNKELNIAVKDPILRKVSSYSFYNVSPFTFEKLLDDPDNIEANFRSYLNGFSENVRNIIEHFKLYQLLIREKSFIYCPQRVHRS